VIHVGFTGTREGLSPRQRVRLTMMLTFAKAGPGVLHHGDCVGADAEAHELALRCGWQVVVHPPIEAKLRAWCGIEKCLICGPNPRPGCTFCNGEGAVESDPQRITILDPADYLVRDRAIVDACEFLVAAPKSEAREGGTWYTVGYAEQVGRKHEVLKR
jgi:hypothetical protein